MDKDNKYKVIYRIAGTEPYSYWEFEDWVNNHEEAALGYQRTQNAQKSLIEANRGITSDGTGLPEPEFNKVLDKYLATKTMTSSEYESLDRSQKDTIQRIKRHFARLKAKE